MKIYAIFAEMDNKPRFFVEARDIEELKKILIEREKKGEPFTMFPGWCPIEISRYEMYHILNRFNVEDTYLVDEDKRSEFNMFARWYYEDGQSSDTPIIEELKKYKLYRQKYSVNVTEDDKNFDVDKIVKYLDKYKSELPKIWSWNVKIDRLVELETISKEQVKEIETNKLSAFEKELLIKRIVCKKLNETLNQNNKELFGKLSLWVIKDWGGIYAGDDEKAIKLIDNFLKEDKPDFERIASTSKVGAFLRPDRNVIYDSRVAYSLNWIILSENAGQKFFPDPGGRNPRMLAFDMNVLIRLKNISVYRPNDIKDLKQGKFSIKNLDKKNFIDERDAYFELNNLVKQIHQQLWKNDKEKEKNLYFTEMLLFSIADREVFMDITNKSFNF